MKSEHFDDSISTLLAEFQEKAREKGYSEGYIEEKIPEIIEAAFEEGLPGILGRLRRTRKGMIREHRRMAKSFERSLARNWGELLDKLYAVLVACEEIGMNSSQKNRDLAIAEDDLAFTVLSGLHARSCRISKEIHALISSGFPQGALARCRTLHEIAATAILIGDHGRSEGYEDIALRYYEHRHVSSYKEALAYQENCSRTGHSPFSDEEMLSLKSAYDDALDEHGQEFRYDYGWAYPIFDHKPNFREIEEKAGIDHLRSYYKWSSNEVHSGSRGWHENTEMEGDRSWFSTGKTANQIVDPAQLSGIYLNIVTTTAVVQGSIEGPAPSDLLYLYALKGLLDEFMDAAQEHIERQDKPSTRTNYWKIRGRFSMFHRK